MNTEGKAKAYDEIIEKATKMHNENCEACQMCIEELIPELKESEDERIRKEMIFYFQEEIPLCSIQEHADKMKEFIAWLEKQGSQNVVNSAKTCKDEKKPADLKTKVGNWYVCDMEVMNENMVTTFHRNEIYYCPKDGYLDVCGALFEVGCLDVFRLATEKEIPQSKQKPAETEKRTKGNDREIPNSAWSEEDISKINTIIGYIASSAGEKLGVLLPCIDWLKSLKDRYTWKPSDEQVMALRWVLNHIPYDSHKEEISGLLEQLKKLKDEK